MTPEEYKKHTGESFQRHETRVREAFAQLDIVRDTLAQIQADLDAGPTRKPKVSFTVCGSYVTAQVHVRLKSGTHKVDFGERTLKDFLRTGDLGTNYNGTNLDHGTHVLFATRFQAAVQEFCHTEAITIDPHAFLWDRVSRERAGEVLLEALNKFKLEDIDSVEKKRLHEQRVLFDRVRRVLEDTCGDGHAQTTRAVPTREALVQTILGSTAHRDPFSIYYRKNINPWANSEKTKYKYAQVDYELTQEDAEQLADEILVKKVMGA